MENETPVDNLVKLDANSYLCPNYPSFSFLDGGDIIFHVNSDFQQVIKFDGRKFSLLLKLHFKMRERD